jgi:hypothetical protein
VPPYWPKSRRKEDEFAKDLSQCHLDMILKVYRMAISE